MSEILDQQVTNLKPVLDEERELILRLRGPDLSRALAPDDLFGLALSGGGIRSATFSLGVIQALARQGLLRRIDYLSTVSGGGYIGSWLSAWIRRVLVDEKKSAIEAITAIEREISPGGQVDRFEPDEISFLREYTSYLTPRIGLFSSDTLALLAGYLRNIALNLFLGAISILSGIALLHSLLAVISRGSHDVFIFIGMELLGISAAFAITCLTLQNIAALSEKNIAALSQKNIAALSQNKIVIFSRSMTFTRKIMSQTVPFSILLGAQLMFIGFYFVQSSKLEKASPVAIAGPFMVFLIIMLICGVASGIYIALFYNVSQDRNPNSRNFMSLLRYTIHNKDDQKIWSAALVWRTVLAICVCGISFYYILILADNFKLFAADLGGNIGIAYAAMFGPGICFVGLFAIYLLWIGVVGNSYSEFTREWLSRLFGQLGSLTGAWMVVAAAIVFCRPAWRHFATIDFFREQLGRGSVLVALAATFGVFLIGANLPPTRENKTNFFSIATRRALGGITSWITVMIVLIGLTIVYQTAVFSICKTCITHDIGSSFWHTVEQHLSNLRTVLHSSSLLESPAVTILFWLGLLAAGGFYFIDVNTFSLQNIYRNRLVRCYLGAIHINERTPDPYAGFDPTDDLELCDFAFQRPYLLCNATLNITKLPQLAWQQRKAASFVFSPKWCGYWLDKKDTSGSEYRGVYIKGGYVRTENYANEPASLREASNGVMVGTAIATSGAAISSQMGFASREPRAFLLTLLNLRLGRWFPNPALPANSWRRHSPLFALAWYLRELLGKTDERSEWIYASDGGHFENLGIYELVRRRCRCIICVDAGADPQRSFEDLGNAVQKCRVDLGVSIKIDVEPLLLDPTDGRSRTTFASGTIEYPGTSAFRGTLVYIKPSISKAIAPLPRDILSYQARHPEFPHEPTHNQWFSETQFESYRKLGYLAGMEALQHHTLNQS